MKQSNFSEAQIFVILKQAEDGTAISEVCRKAGISDATFYNWRKKYSGLLPSEMRRLRSYGDTPLNYLGRNETSLSCLFCFAKQAALSREGRKLKVEA